MHLTLQEWKEDGWTWFGHDSLMLDKLARQEMAVTEKDPAPTNTRCRVTARWFGECQFMLCHEGQRGSGQSRRQGALRREAMPTFTDDRTIKSAGRYVVTGEG